MRPSWDDYFIGLCLKIAERSEDRSTKVGCIAVGPDKEIRSTGYNGFPRYVADSEDRHQRPKKYFFFAHAEENAITQAARIGVSLKGCTLYVFASSGNLPPCATCARMIVQSGITRVVCGDGDVPDRWKDSIDASLEMMSEAGIELVRIKKDKP